MYCSGGVKHQFLYNQPINKGNCCNSRRGQQCCNAPASCPCPQTYKAIPVRSERTTEDGRPIIYFRIGNTVYPDDCDKNGKECSNDDSCKCSNSQGGVSKPESMEHQQEDKQESIKRPSTAKRNSTDQTSSTDQRPSTAKRNSTDQTSSTDQRPSTAKRNSTDQTSSTDQRPSTANRNSSDQKNTKKISTDNDSENVIRDGDNKDGDNETTTNVDDEDEKADGKKKSWWTCGKDGCPCEKIVVEDVEYDGECCFCTIPGENGEPIEIPCHFCFNDEDEGCGKGRGQCGGARNNCCGRKFSKFNKGNRVCCGSYRYSGGWNNVKSCCGTTADNCQQQRGCPSQRNQPGFKIKFVVEQQKDDK